MKMLRELFPIGRRTMAWVIAISLLAWVSTLVGGGR